MLRLDCLRSVYSQLENCLVVTIMGAVAAELQSLGHRPNFFYLQHAMGLASSTGLGLALCLPEQKVIVFDGDGSLLMNLGSLVTIAAVGPKNLVHFVAHNDTYEANGGHPIPNPKVDFASIARAAGYAACYDFSDLDVFTQQVAHVLEQDGPVFASLHVEPSKQLNYDYPSLYDPAKRVAFKAAW